MVKIASNKVCMRFCNYNNKEDKHVLSENYYRLKLYVKKNKKQID